MAVEDRVSTIVQPIVDDLGLYLYDLTYASKRLVVTLDTDGDGELDAGVLALATRQISRQLDETDPIATNYTLEVTTPGVERKLRTVEHYRRAIGESVAIKLRDADATKRRVEGELIEAGESSFTVRSNPGADADTDPTAASDRRIDYGQVQRARVVYDWHQDLKRHNASNRGANQEVQEKGSAAR